MFSLMVAVRLHSQYTRFGSMRFRGSFTALITPFRNGGIDEKAFESFCDWQISEGTNGLVPVGTTGESPTCRMTSTSASLNWQSAWPGAACR